MATKNNSKKIVHKNTKKSLSKKATHKKSKVRDNPYKKLAIAVIIAVISIATIALIAKNNNEIKPEQLNVENKATIMLENSLSSVKVGKKVTMNLYSDSANTTVNVAQAVIKYPSNQLTLLSIDTDSSAYPIKAYESSKEGSIEIARGVLGGVQNKKLIAKLEFLAKSPGNATLEYDKSKTMLISESGNQNIINVNGLATTPLEVTN